MTLRTSEQYEEYGRSLLMKGHIEQSLAAFREGLVRFPGERELMLGVAMAHNSMGDFVEATELLEPLRLEHPGWGDALMGLAEAYLAMGRKTDAVACIEEATTLGATDCESIHCLAVLLYRHRHYEDALRVERTAIARGPGYGPAHLGAGACLHRLDRVEEALPELRRAVELAPEDWEARAYLGSLLFRRGERAEARVLLEPIPVPHIHSPTTAEHLAAVLDRPEDAPRRAAALGRRERLLEGRRRERADALLERAAQAFDKDRGPS